MPGRNSEGERRQPVPPQRTEQRQREMMNRIPREQARAEVGQSEPRRLPTQRQQELINRQQQRMAQYRQHLDQRQRVAPERIEQLRRQNRLAQYRFQQQYLDRIRQQQLRIRNERHDYYRDPYFYTAPNYRYFRGGTYYETNQYGVDMLRRAANYGYEEGYNAGLADRRDGWRFSPEDSFAYQDADYGYDGYYVDEDTYNYYFREGFRRGYEDGYYSRYQYGVYADGNYRILDNILRGILRLTPLG
jgi:hypothetical protein